MAGRNLALRNQRMSVACISEPEFLNITSINPLISKAEVKVLYVGENRNRSFISKEVATKMAGTLPGCPIVGYYRQDKEDFFDHGDVVTIDGDGVKFSDATRPYGFVAPNAKIWFQRFIDTDECGIETEREYLMTEAFLWTGQYPECQRVEDEGNPQSMKLHDETLQGNWAKTGNSNVEFFIINDAIVQNLCILGEAVEPCFEGADITAPKLSANFSKNDENISTLFSMMKELKDLLSQEGGHSMFENEEIKTEDTSVKFETVVKEEENVQENFSNEQDKVDEVTQDENQNITEEFKKQDEKEEKPSDDKKEEETSEKDSESKDDTSDDEDKKKKKEEDFACGDKEDKKKYELLESEYAELEAKYSTLETSYNELVAFKNSIEDKQKDELIASFYMLDDEDKKNVIEKKAEYSLDDIEKELSVICVRKKVNFNLDSEDEATENEQAVTTFNLDSLESDDCSLPAWLKAVEETSNLHK